MSIKALVYGIAGIHLMLILGNVVAIPLLVAYTPFYIWMPLLTVMVNPAIGGTTCVLNDVENHFRKKAGMSLIGDRFSATRLYIRNTWLSKQQP